jgi:hypothetical protein
MASIGRIAPLREPPKERPESVPKLPSYGGAKAFPPSTTGPPTKFFSALCLAATIGHRFD